MHIFRGEVIDKEDIYSRIDSLKPQLIEDLCMNTLNIEIVLNAVEKLKNVINVDDVLEFADNSEIPEYVITSLYNKAMHSLKRENLQKKINQELGENPFDKKWITDNIYEVQKPLGVLSHIGAGNVVALSFVSLIEGLLTGNINIVKLPSYESGLTLYLTKILVELEPRLKPYIYILDISSNETEILKHIASLSDAVVVWGSTSAISGIRALTPISTQVIEWGHKISFAYFEESENMENDLYDLAVEICEHNQQYCSSPQCVFIDTNSEEKLYRFAENLSKNIFELESKFPNRKLSFQENAEITMIQYLHEIESIISDKSIFRKGSNSVLIGNKTELKPSPLNRNVWVMKGNIDTIKNEVFENRAFLQTVGLSCCSLRREFLSNVFSQFGVSRITKCNEMSNPYIGESHDGRKTLNQYVKVVSMRK